MKYIASIGDTEYEIDITGDNQIYLNGKKMAHDLVRVGESTLISLLINGHSYEAYAYQENGEWRVLLHGKQYTVEVEDERERKLRAASGHGVIQSGEFHLRSPMPGLIIKMPFEVGDDIQKGEVLVILESMKMQNELRAPKDGQVTRIFVAEGDSVEQKQSLVSIN